MHAKFKKHITNASFILKIHTDYIANNVDPKEVAHYEPPHLDLHCLKV